MKFNEDKISRLANALKAINALNLGGYSLPDRFGLHKDGEVKAILVSNGNKYEIEILDETIVAEHDAEVSSTDEIKEK